MLTFVSKMYTKAVVRKRREKRGKEEIEDT